LILQLWMSNYVRKSSIMALDNFILPLASN
jgi:hypothetical protein